MIRFLSLLVLSSTAIASSYGVFYSPFDISSQQYPTGPNERLTPGDLCERNQSNTFRYPERILYCNRSVSSGEKQSIIRAYDRELGFQIGQMNRQDFKIDHYIPLCMGGSNDDENLWPQHKSIYQITDGLEGKMCELMSKGKLTQVKAVETIRHAKKNLDEVPTIQRWVNDQF